MIVENVEIGKIYDIRNCRFPVFIIRYHINCGVYNSPNVLYIVASKDNKKWQTVYRMPNFGVGSHTVLTCVRVDGYKYASVRWGCWCNNGIGEPSSFIGGKCKWYNNPSNPDVVVVRLADMYFSKEYVEKVVGYVLSHRKSELCWGAPVGNKTLCDNHVIGSLKLYGVFNYPPGACNIRSGSGRCVGPYGEWCYYGGLFGVLPPGKYKLNGKILKLVPGWWYGKEPVEIVNGTVEFDCFVGYLHSDGCRKTYIEPIEIYKPNIRVGVGKIYSNISTVAEVNGKLVWINKGWNNVCGDVVIDGVKYRVPRKKICNIKYNDGKVTFYSNYSGKAVVVVDGSKKEISVIKGVNTVKVDKFKKLCVGVV